ncbi:MAG TPA: Uma2 family endonuclease, partial [Anaerolineae bacterium]|nr:Uma2 family endonuclease [Anaerolineae bacterium]
TPAPSTKHQRILLALVIRLSDYLKQHPLGELFFAPVDVRMGNLANPVQPDLLFIARDRLNIVKEDYIDGAPDLIAEALSPGSQSYDRRTKFNLYARAGVKEYWLIDPQSCVVEIYVLRGQAYAPLGAFNSNQLLRSEILPDLKLPVQELC